MYVVHKESWPHEDHASLRRNSELWFDLRVVLNSALMERVLSQRDILKA